MVTHAKDIVDRMNKRVIAIEKGKIVRDDVGSYGLEQLYAGIEMTTDTLQHWREMDKTKAETVSNDQTIILYIKTGIYTGIQN